MPQMPAARVSDTCQHGGVIMPPGAVKTMVEMLPAARVTDMHVCPMVTGVVPHVGGPVITGAFTIMIEMLPATRVMEKLVCVGPPDMIAKGASKTFYGDGGGGGGAMVTMSPPSAPPAVAPGMAPPSAPASPNAPAPPGGPGSPAAGTPNAPVSRTTNEGDPIDVATGRMFSLYEEFATQGQPMFRFMRFYSVSDAEKPGDLGYGWTHSLRQRLEISDEFFTYCDWQGRRILFPLLPEGDTTLYHLIENVQLRLVPGGYEIALADGNILCFAPNDGGKSARLIAIRSDDSETALQLEYQGELLRRVTDAIGDEFLFETEDNRHISAITFRPKGAVNALSVARYAYDGGGNLIAVYDALNYQTRYFYDGSRRMIQRTDRNGHSFCWQYDAKNRCVRAWGDAGLFDQTFQYSETDPLTVVRDAEGRTVSYVYNDLGMVTEVTDALGNQQKFAYVNGKISAVTDALGRVTEYAYDPYGRVTTMKRPGGGESRIDYHPDGGETLTDGLENVLQTTQKGDLRETRLPDSDTLLMTARADSAGRRVIVKDGRGHETIHVYDDAGREIRREMPQGLRRRFEYDAQGNRTVETDPNGAVTRRRYDPRRQLAAIEREDGSRFQFQYDAEGNLSHFVDGIGRVTRYEFGRFERLTARTDPAGNVTRYEYDHYNRLSRFTDARARETRFYYDEVGRPQRILHPDNYSDYLTFDAAGQLTRYLDRGGAAMDCAYDADGNLISRRYTDGGFIAREHDANGRIVRADNEAAELTFQYEAQGRLISETQDGAEIGYEYDLVGNLAALVLPMGERIEYEYDPNNRLSVVRDMNGGEHRFAYAPAGQRKTHRYPNGLTAQYAHTRLGLVSEVALTQERTARTEMQRHYRYDANDDVTEIADSALGRVAYHYDAAGRIERAERQNESSSETFAYDAAGNITARNGVSGLQYDEANRYRGSGRERCAHDPRGNVIWLEDARGLFRFAYNSRNEMIRAELPDGATAEYGYDAFGRRLYKRVGETETRFLWSGDRMLGEMTTRGEETETRWYLYAPGSYEPLAMRVNGVYYAFHCDHRGAPLRVSDADGAIVWLSDYAVYGEARIQANATDHALRFPGQYYDAETGLHYNRTRYYHPQWGRYLSPDPMGLEGGPNPYVYADDDPINKTDPMGLFPGLVIAALIVLAVVAIVAIAALIVNALSTPNPGANAPGTVTPVNPPPPGGTTRTACGKPAGTGTAANGDPATPPPPKPGSAGYVDPDAPPDNGKPEPARDPAVEYKIWNLHWEPAEGSCGDKVTLVGSTNLPDDATANFALTPDQGTSPDLVPLAAKASGGTIRRDWHIKDVSFALGAGFADSVNVTAKSTDGSVPSNDAPLKVKALLDAPETVYERKAGWESSPAVAGAKPQQFSNTAHFKQKIDKFTNKISVAFDFVKGWGATTIDLTKAGITGSVANCPFNGSRWARSTTGVMQPDQYHDGKDWQPMPTGFTVTDECYGGCPLVKSGDKFVSIYGAQHPMTFADYAINAPDLVARRAAWVQDTHDVWSNRFHIKRKGCQSQPGTRCCRYDVEVNLAFNEVAAYDQSKGVIVLCPGEVRSNTILWAMGDSRIKVAAHEAGHHMDNPDEYPAGGMDKSVNGDGAVNGVDADSIMGQNLTNAKKRHFVAFATVNSALIKDTYGKSDTYEVVDK